MLDRMLRDARYAARALARTPLFALTAILSIAIGVGATSAIVTLASALLFRPPPGVGDPQRVVSVGRTTEGQGFDNMGYPAFAAYRDGASSLAALAAVRMEPQDASLAGPGGAEPIKASLVSGDFFEILQARPSVGRFFLPDEDRAAGTSSVAVLSHAFWRERFGGDRSIVGRGVVLNGQPFTVVGVAEERFNGPFVMAPDVWVPMRSAATFGLPASIFESRGASWLVAIGRLAPGATVAGAQAELATINARLAAEHPTVNEGHGVSVVPASLMPGELGRVAGGFMAMLFATATLVLVIASTNVAGMLLARASVRQREIAVRLAIGASRAQLVRQLLTESLILFAIAGAAGLLLAKWLVSGLLALVPRLPVQLAVDARLDWRVFLFALGAALLAGLVAGLVPAWQASRPDLVRALKSEGGATGRRQRLRSALLVTQITFSMLLLIVAGLFARTLVHARDIATGFDHRDVALAALDLQLASYDSVRGPQFTQRLLESAARLPGARSVALSAAVPLDGNGLGLGGIEVAGVETPKGRDGWDMDWSVVTPGYFATLGIPIVRGRDFDDGDTPGRAEAAIINETFARALFPGQDPIGRTMRNGSRTLTVVGVARDAKYRTLGEDPRNFIYVPLAQRWFERLTLMVKTEPGAEPTAAIRKLVADLDPALPILRQGSLEEQIGTSLFPQRLALWVAGTLGTVALLLALLGIYGVTAFSVAQRTREIGVRVALGADRARILRLVLRQGVVLAVLGVVIGAAAAAGVTRLVRGLLYGVPPTDAIAFGGAAIVLSLAALAASWIPARRAAAVDPVVALRSE